MKRFVMVCMVISLLFCSCGHRAGNPHPDTVEQQSGQEHSVVGVESEVEVQQSGLTSDSASTVETGSSEILITEGVYTIRSFCGTKVVNLSGKTDAATDKDGTNIMMWTSTGSNMQTFRIDPFVGDGRCYLCPLSSSNGNGGRTLDVEHSAMISSGDNIQLYEKSHVREQGQLFYIQEVEEGAYAILLASDPALAMTFAELEKNNANLYLDTFVGRKEQLFAFIPKAEASDGKKDTVEENFDRRIVEQIRKTYALIGSPANGYVEPDLGIYFAQGDMGLIFEETEAMSAWYGQYFESGKVPADVVKRVMQGDEKCVGMFFFLRDIGIKQEIMPDSTIVGKAEENPLDGSYGYYFIQNGYQVRLDCTESGTITGDSYCLVYLAQ